MGRLKRTTRPIICAMKTNGIVARAMQKSEAYGWAREMAPARKFAAPGQERLFPRRGVPR